MTSFYTESALITKILGALIYFRPSEFSDNGLDRVLALQVELQESSSLIKTFQNVLEQFNRADINALNMAHDEFFSGIGDMPAPPWGSVYLDRECVLFGESTAEYKQFLVQQGFEFETHNNDPLDHIGLMLMTLGALLENQTTDQLSPELEELLGHHLLPWAPHYLKQVEALINEPAYVQAISLTQTLLSDLQTAFNLPVKPRQIYFKVAQ
ncbi:molecular chaperone TorD family protein [Vibrio algivorus]|uniref:Dehydrogenase n=1 Tax=Vibrio algivorus TaxID=1667024 RepID=A0A557NY28_9VIBR|nr:molecular chaperone TorD family protein [Vibrio algivorus]TVO33323.1 dehydrogenase [Vibrio algivorus]